MNMNGKKNLNSTYANAMMARAFSGFELVDDIEHIPEGGWAPFKKDGTESQNIVAHALPYLIGFRHSDPDANVTFTHEVFLSLECDAGDGTAESIPFYLDDYASDIQGKLMKLVGNGFTVQGFTLNGKYQFQLDLLEKFFEELKEYGGTLDTWDGVVKFIPFAGMAQHYWDLVFGD